MAETEKKRVRRTAEERVFALDMKKEELEKSIQSIEEKKQAAISVFDEKIEKIQGKITVLEKQKAAILSPKAPRKPRKSKKQKIQNLMKQAQKAGLKPEEIAERLGLSVEE